jgi:hypothetical protein
MDEPKTRDVNTAKIIPLRSATPIDAETAKPHPEDAALAERAEAELESRRGEPADAISADARSKEAKTAAETQAQKQSHRTRRTDRSSLGPSREAGDPGRT